MLVNPVTEIAQMNDEPPLYVIYIIIQMFSKTSTNIK